MSATKSKRTNRWCGRRAAASVLALALAQGAGSAYAAPELRFELVSLGGDLYQYHYTLFNDGSIGAITEWSVELADTLYDRDSLEDRSTGQFTVTDLATMAETQTDQWSAVVLNDPLFDTVPSYSASSFSEPLEANRTITGFAVEFLYLGSGEPGPQNYEVFADLGSFSGNTESAAPIPVPAPLVLLVSGLACLLSRSRTPA